MPKKPPFSIVTPTLNEEKIIGETLKALKRMAPDAEYVVADGRSSDKTEQVALKNGAHVVFEGRGFRSIGAGRNAGARASKSAILVFIDADTIPQPVFFERMLKEFEDSSVVGVGCKIMPGELTPMREFIFEILNLFVKLSVRLDRPSIAGNCVAYRRDAFFKISGFDEEMQASEDQDLCVRISKLGRVVYLTDVTAFTSSRRLKKMGWIGLAMDWGGTTLNFLSGRKTTRYAIIREI
ncbi:hypothetical protein COT29_04230 [Candidatus Micrarchaeota archaeon CG08_land_8_20_14_0_20_59_11]|nr:MAG: hypothetical protein COT29_04230 [Candidatus Micrarchaeota archaeon CG08_land_8_20_14_0_20_59_11]